jgi:hypothetical protein
MKVKELIDELQKLHPDSEVILQKDGEGNGYSPLAAVDGDAVYMPETTWSGEVYSMGWTAEDACKDEDEWAEIVAKPRCVVLAPTN